MLLRAEFSSHFHFLSCLKNMHKIGLCNYIQLTEETLMISLISLLLHSLTDMCVNNVEL